MIFLMLSSPALGQDDASSPGEMQVASSSETEQELLMFWEKKDLYVQTATRYEKPISQTAENITVITAKDIEEMNAHTVDEVLNRVTGIFVDFQGGDFGSTSLLHIQNSQSDQGRHVLVVVDGIPWNTLASGNAITTNIPVGIIERIEVIQGPASSAWGSSLGGVINIITKAAGSEAAPSGTVSASYGTRNSQDYKGEIFGKAGGVGYYLFAGRERSDGLRDNRNFENNSFYAKVSVPLSGDVKVGLNVGYSDPRSNFGDFPSGDIKGIGNIGTLFGSASIDAAITKELSLKASLYSLHQKDDLGDSLLGLGTYGESGAGAPFLRSIFDEKSYGGDARLIWQHGMHTAVLGLDMSHGSLRQTLDAGPVLQSFGLPASDVTSPSVDKWALYANDTMSIDRLSITPGIRFDHDSITGSFLSPSFGATYKLAEKTLLRASVARGFSAPPLAWTSGGVLLTDPNPSLKPEKVWSYQAGVESSVTDYLWLKATLFQYSLSGNIQKVGGAPPPWYRWEANTGDIGRHGFELEAETAPVYNMSLKAGVAYVMVMPQGADHTGNYEYNLSLKYDDKKSFRAELFGHYIWWDMPSGQAANYNAFVWDLNLAKKIYSTPKTATEIFMTAHNIFNGSQYSFGDQKNPGRWVEAGVRFKF